MSTVILGRRDRRGYLPLDDYGLIGDCRSAALVGLDGSIDWLCLPRFDDPSLFARILDSDHGGYWQIRPTDGHQMRHHYRDRSNVLRTAMVTSTGRANLIDFMPADAAEMKQHARPHARPRIIRVVHCLAGEVEIESLIEPAPDYGRSQVHFETTDNRFHGDDHRHHYCIRATVPLQGPRTVVRLKAGESIAFGLYCNRRGACPAQPFTLRRALNQMRDTQTFWWQWIEQCHYRGPFQEHVWRSALVLKLLTYAPTGAIVAAPTASLPERVGGDRNWDYRYTWLRDASFTLYAFFQMGFVEEARGFYSWLQGIGLDKGVWDIPVLYTVDGGHDTPESVLDHFEGYRRSRPVRIGNAAVNQLQLDVYGEILDSAYLYARFGHTVTKEFWGVLEAVVNLAVERWQEPDRSIWEPRGGDKHYTYSKVMCWVALDRGLRIAERFGLPHPAAKWKAARRAIHAAITSQGYSPKLRSFTQVFGGDTVDAALLRMAQSRFLHGHDERMASTIRTIERQLADGIMVRRYRRSEADTGSHSNEGGFLMTSFWLADALAHVGRWERAEDLFEQLVSLSSPLNLFAEEADSVTAIAVGNTPQAFTHLALVGAAVNIERARHSQLGAHRAWG